MLAFLLSGQLVLRHKLPVLDAIASPTLHSYCVRPPARPLPLLPCSISLRVSMGTRALMNDPQAAQVTAHGTGLAQAPRRSNLQESQTSC